MIRARAAAAILGLALVASLTVPAASSAPPTRGAPPPVFSESFNAGLRSGTVLIKPKGEQKFRRLEGIESIPLGSSVDATSGVMWLQSQLEDGTYESIDYYDGRFSADQDESGLVTLKLQGANFGSCKDRSARGNKGYKNLGRLWGNGRGKARTKGRGGSGTVRGTIWLTEERCDGTFFRVAEGSIKVRDFGRDRNVVLDAGEKYLAETD